jgi:hypothetical protein
MKNPNFKEVKVIDSLWTFIVALACLGPFALPLLWRNPRFSRRIKVVGTVFIVIFTAGLTWWFADSSSQLMKQVQELKSMQESSP